MRRFVTFDAILLTHHMASGREFRHTLFWLMRASIYFAVVLVWWFAGTIGQYALLCIKAHGLVDGLAFTVELAVARGILYLLFVFYPTIIAVPCCLLGVLPWPKSRDDWMILTFLATALVMWNMVWSALSNPADCPGRILYP